MLMRSWNISKPTSTNQKFKNTCSEAALWIYVLCLWNLQVSVLHWSGQNSSSALCPKPSEERRWTSTGCQEAERTALVVFFMLKTLTLENASAQPEAPSVCFCFVFSCFYCFQHLHSLWFYLFDISKRSLTELTLQLVVPQRSSSCSQSEADSNQFMWESRRRLLRNCFISGEGKAIQTQGLDFLFKYYLWHFEEESRYSI